MRDRRSPTSPRRRCRRPRRSRGRPIGQRCWGWRTPGARRSVSHGLLRYAKGLRSLLVPCCPRGGTWFPETLGVAPGVWRRSRRQPGSAGDERRPFGVSRPRPFAARLITLDRPVGLLSKFCDKLPRMSTVMKHGPRERLLSAAVDLTYAYGMGVGVDAILKEADVARRSLYQHFGGKDGLLVEVIRVTSAEDERAYRAALEAGGTDPRKRILSAFDAVCEAVSTPGFRGCRYIAADLALT